MFKEMKKLLTAIPILRMPDYSKPFVLYTEASDVAIGAVLGQINQDRNKYACAYGSRTFNRAKRNYAVTEQECLAVVWACKHF